MANLKSVLGELDIEDLTITNIVLLILVCVLQLIDLHTTQILIASGIKEGNPIMRQIFKEVGFSWNFVAIKLFWTGAVILVVEKNIKSSLIMNAVTIVVLYYSFIMSIGNVPMTLLELDPSFEMLHIYDTILPPQHVIFLVTAYILAIILGCISIDRRRLLAWINPNQ